MEESQEKMHVDHGAQRHKKSFAQTSVTVQTAYLTANVKLYNRLSWVPFTVLQLVTGCETSKLMFYDKTCHFRYKLTVGHVTVLRCNCMRALNANWRDTCRNFSPKWLLINC